MNPEENFITLYGVLIQEPMTALTDFLTVGVCLFAFIKLYQLKRTSRPRIWFALYFLFLAISTFNAAIFGHAFLYIFGIPGKVSGWIFAAPAVFYLENASLYCNPKYKFLKDKNWIGILLIKLLLFYFLLWMPETRSFELVKINSAIGIALISLGSFIYTWVKTKKKVHRNMCLALLLCFLPGIVYQLEISFHLFFNHNDISHVLMAGCCYVLYRNIRTLLEAEYPPLEV